MTSSRELPGPPQNQNTVLWLGRCCGRVCPVSVDNGGDPRHRLLDAAARLLETGGPEAVQTRRLAAEAAVSTMAVYSCFGGMNGLWNAMVRAGFGHMGAYLENVPSTDEAAADLFVLAGAYRRWALSHPQLYRAMFGLVRPPGRKRSVDIDLTDDGAGSAASPPAEAESALDVVVAVLERLEGHGIVTGTAPAAAGQFLSALHGYVLLEMGGYFGPAGNGMAWVFGPLVLSLAVGLGVSRPEAERAALTALLAEHLVEAPEEALGQDEAFDLAAGELR
jgi:AcrR family transcriptional regulator